MNKLIEKFPGFPLHSKEELEQLSSKELVDVFNKLNDIKETVNSKNIQLKTQIESAEKDLKKTEGDIFEKYGVKSLEALEELKKEKMVKFQESYEKLISLDV